MSPSSNDRVRFVSLTLTVFAFVVSCAFIDLREVSVSTDPAAPGSVLPSRDTPVRVIFGTDVDQNEAEQAFAVSSEKGNVEGDIRWDGASFSFTPVAGWESGVRYKLKLEGSISAKDGREARPDIDLPFTAVREAGAPIVKDAAPADGNSTGTSPEEGALVALYFSEAMDKRSVENAFSLEPSTELDFTWSDADTVFTATPRAPLSPCVAYRWSLETTARAVDGAPLARAASGRFATDGDHVPPQVSGVYRAVRSLGAWIPMESGLAGLGANEAVIVEFSEPMSEETVLRAVRVEPSLTGVSEAPTLRSVVFIPDRPPEYGVSHTLVVSSDAADRAGLKLGTEYREVFVPSVPPLSVISIITESGEEVPKPYATKAGAGTARKVTLTSTDALLTLNIRFSHFITAAARAAAIERISVSAFFPGSLPSPAAKSVSWLALDRVSLTWDGLEKSIPNEAHYYSLFIDGGKEGITDGNGLYLASDVVVLLEANP